MVVKEFREKWPVDPATVEEIANTQSAEHADKIKRDKYDQVR